MNSARSARPDNGMTVLSSRWKSLRRRPRQQQRQSRPKEQAVRRSPARATARSKPVLSRTRWIPPRPGAWRVQASCPLPCPTTRSRQNVLQSGRFVSSFSDGNLRLCDHVVVRHRQSATMAEYVERVASRALSDLVSLSDEEFASGMQALRRYGATARAHTCPAIDIDFL